MRPRRHAFHRSVLVATLAATAALVLSSAVSTAQGLDLDGDRVPDDIEDVTMREVDWDLFEPDIFVVASRSLGAPADDRFKVAYEDGVFEVSYFREVPGGPTGVYTLEVPRIFEWRDFDVDEEIEDEEIVAEWAMGTSAFANGTLTHASWDSDDGGHVYVFRVRVSLGPQTEATFVLTVAQRFLRVDAARTLTPMEAKLDVLLNHTPAYPGSGSRIGLEFRIESEGSYDVEYQEESWNAARGFSEDESWVNVTNGPMQSTMFFSWANRASVNGVPGDVTVSTTPGEGSGERSLGVRIAFPRSDETSVRILHDPALGVVSAAYEGILLKPAEPTLEGDVFLYGASLAGMAAVVAASVVLANRRHQRK